MTESQLRYQTLMESQRHNLEMERLGYHEASAKAEQARAQTSQAKTAAYRAKGEMTMEADYLPYKEMQALGSAISGIFKGVGSVASLFA